MVVGARNDHDRATIFSWMRSSLLTSVALIGFQTNEAYSSFGLSSVNDDYDDECGSK